MLAKMDSLGNLLWYRDFPVGNENAWFRNVYPTADGGFIMPGSAVDGPSGNQDAWLVKVDSLGCDSNGCALYTALPPSESTVASKVEMQVYPNPCANFFVCKLDRKHNYADTYTVTVTNSTGQIVLQQKMVNNTLPHPVFVHHLPSGLYCVQLNIEDVQYFAKFVKQ
ncbi:MAG: T9SS type A sorting domain-containing protein [Bacteroidetes bacterium]|nr:T9SS type A sorting domain-containing protein [Bacteroidota bacterium]